MAVALAGAYALMPSGRSGGSVDRSIPVVKFERQTAPPMIVSVRSVDDAAHLTGSPDRKTLARMIQERLTDAKCYSGAVHGIWTDDAKAAMRRFSAATNARLPVDIPDQAHLALIESNATANCADERTVDRNPPALAAAAVSARVAAVATQPVSSQPVSSPAIASQAVNGARADMPDRLVEPVVAVAPAPGKVSRPVVLEAVEAVPDVRTQARTQSSDLPPAAKVDRPARARALVHQSRKATQRSTVYRKPKPFEKAAKSFSRSVKNLQRSVMSIFN